MSCSNTEPANKQLSAISMLALRRKNTKQILLDRPKRNGYFFFYLKCQVHVWAFQHTISRFDASQFASMHTAYALVVALLSSQLTPFCHENVDKWNAYEQFDTATQQRQKTVCVRLCIIARINTKKTTLDVLSDTDEPLLCVPQKFRFGLIFSIKAEKL